MSIQTIPPFSFLRLNLHNLPLHVIGTLDLPAYGQLMSIQESFCVCQIIMPISFHSVPNTQIVLIPLSNVNPIQFNDLPTKYQESVKKSKSILREFYHWTEDKPGSSLVPLSNYSHDDKNHMSNKKKGLESGKKDLYSYYLFNALLNTNPHLQWNEGNMVIGSAEIPPPFTKAVSKKENDFAVDRIQAMLDAAHNHARIMMEKHNEFSLGKKSSTTWAGLVKQSSPSTVSPAQPLDSSPESMETANTSVDEKKKKPYKKRFNKQKSEDRFESSRGTERRGRARGRGRGFSDK
eukprot:NODE_362_length_10118_cov_0.149117.p4 type:complete len:292 gc:universal NODE_362_length_10118_cov_0.149117:7294-8169(+)